MNKTRVGISTTLMGTIICFSGIISFVVAILVAGYALLFEKDDWLRKIAVKMILVVLFFGVAMTSINLIDYALSVINTILNWFFTVNIRIPVDLKSLFNLIAMILRDGLLIVMGVLALKNDTIEVKFVDNLINKHIYKLN